MTLASLQNYNIHTYLIEKIRCKTTEMEQNQWKIQFCWVKAHAGNLGNEHADTAAKGAVTNLDIAECYNRVPKSVVKSELEDRSVDKCQSDLNRTTKGKITKDYFPIGAERLQMKIMTTHNHAHWTRERKCIFAPFQNIQFTNMPVRRNRSNNRSSAA
jgi:hypothetical protein